MDVREQSKLNLIEAIETKIETATDHREPIEKQDLFRLFLKYGFPAKEGQRIYDEIRAQRGMSCEPSTLSVAGPSRPISKLPSGAQKRKRGVPEDLSGISAGSEKRMKSSNAARVDHTQPSSSHSFQTAITHFRRTSQGHSNQGTSPRSIRHINAPESELSFSSNPTGLRDTYRTQRELPLSPPLTQASLSSPSRQMKNFISLTPQFQEKWNNMLSCAATWFGDHHSEKLGITRWTMPQKDPVRTLADFDEALKEELNRQQTPDRDEDSLDGSDSDNQDEASFLAEKEALLAENEALAAEKEALFDDKRKNLADNETLRNRNNSLLAENDFLLDQIESLEACNKELGDQNTILAAKNTSLQNQVDVAEARTDLDVEGIADVEAKKLEYIQQGRDQARHETVQEALAERRALIREKTAVTKAGIVHVSVCELSSTCQHPSHKREARKKASQLAWGRKELASLGMVGIPLKRIANKPRLLRSGLQIA